jgi:hypothetical protein
MDEYCQAGLLPQTRGEVVDQGDPTGPQPLQTTVQKYPLDTLELRKDKFLKIFHGCNANLIYFNQILIGK